MSKLSSVTSYVIENIIYYAFSFFIEMKTLDIRNDVIYFY